MARLRRVDCSGPGIRRKRRGRGFEYRDEDGRKIDDPEVLARIRELAIPPAWEGVWICPYPMGHIQATGTDAAGRKQYRYHDRWRERRDLQKFESMISFADRLPKLRRHVERDLASDGMPRERALACAVRLLDRGSFRIGSEGYAAENETYGLVTMRKDHVVLRDGAILFDYNAKGGARRRQRVIDEAAFEVIRELKRRRGGGEELLAYRNGRRWRDVASQDVNAYIKEKTGGDHSAKDFRTWNATVIAAIALAVPEPQASETKTGRKRVVKRALEEVARYLGNTPAICRASYVDPRVIDRYDGGLTIGGVLPMLTEDDADWPQLQRDVEEGVLDLIAGDRGSPAVEKI